MNSVDGKGEEWKGESKHLIFYVRVSSEGCKEKKAKACCRLWVPKFAIVSMTVLVCMEKGSEMGKDKAVTIKGNAHFQKSLMVNAVYADKYIALIRHDCNKSKVKGGMIKLRQGPTFFLCSIHQLMQSQTFFSF